MVVYLLSLFVLIYILIIPTVTVKINITLSHNIVTIVGNNEIWGKIHFSVLLSLSYKFCHYINYAGLYVYQTNYYDVA